MAVLWTLLRLIKVLIQIITLPFCKCLSPFLKPFRRHPPKPDYSCDIVLVTGAAQGIGKALALEFAKHGGTLVLWDINETKLQETCSQITSQGYEAFAYVVDCSKKDEIYQTAERVKEEVGNVSVLVNNAGVMAGKAILEFKDEEIEKTLNVNLVSHFWTVRAFLPWMVENDYGHIVEICSLASFNGTPKASDYCSSKGGVFNFAHSLHMELLMQKKLGVSVTCVFPSAVDTELAKMIRILPHKMSPTHCAEEIVKVLYKKPFMLSVGGSFMFGALQRFIIPTNINDELFMLFVGDKTMDELISKKND